ncbi:MAG: four helix bundle protein [Candidatus Eisenbacteria sp.]|nr:four helix bundle protein [Candidatus Eisenbacteria bacterium]
MAFLFEDLDVYKRAVGLAEQIARLTGDFPSGTYAISDQLRRAVISISCNIAEGNGRWHEKEKKHFFMIARGSAFECVPLLDVAQRLELIEKDVYQELRAELDEICAMIMGLVRAVGRKPKASEENRQ